MAGTRLVITGQVLSTTCQPVGQALLDFWQADNAGAYDNAGFRLRGHQFTDANGRFTLETIVPGLYPGRTRHIHVKVQPPGRSILTTQLYFPGEARNASDGIFSPALLMAVSTPPTGKEARFDFVVRAALDGRGSRRLGWMSHRVPADDGPTANTGSRSEAPRFRIGDQQPHRLRRMTPIRARVDVMAVVDDDDVAGGSFARQARGHAVGARALPPVPVPHAPAPPGEPIARPVQPLIHRRASPSRVRAEQPARFAPGNRGDAPGGAASSRAARSSGAVIIRRRVPLCRPIACPSSEMRFTMGSVSGVMCSSIRKKVAWMPASRSASSKRRRPIGVRAVVEGQVDRGWDAGLRWRRATAIATA